MESRRRKIRSGKEFDQLFPPPTKQDVTIRQSGDVEDTLALIRKTVPKSLWHTQRIAEKLKGRTLEETCSNIWHFVYDHIQYKRDKDGVEQVRSPRRTWWERETGVDCDCYTEFISSILLNFGIPHKARITKYPKRYPQVPNWQHIYPIVPRDGNIDREFTDRDSYIVLDCVKDEFDSEQPFLERKDYDMRLDYLDGVEEEESGEEAVAYDPYELMGTEYPEPDSVDFADLASIYDDEELGSIFKKIGKAVSKVAKTVAKPVATVAKTVAKPVAKVAKVVAKPVAKVAKAVAKPVAKVVTKVADKVGDGIRLINRYANPATILLRNGFLLAMKINLFNVAGRLRYGYLTDAQATERNMNIAALGKVRSVKDRAETVYWQAGGKRENLKKGVLNGKGNKDKKVPLNGLFGINDEYMDIEEYQIIHSDPDDVSGLGEIASGTALAAATSAVAAIAAALKQIKGLFNKGGTEEEAFQSETDNAGDASTSPANISEDEDLMLTEPIPDVVSTEEATIPESYAEQPEADSFLPGTEQVMQTLPVLKQLTTKAIVQNDTEPTTSNTTGNRVATLPAPRSVATTAAVSRVLTDATPAPTASNTVTNQQEQKGFVQKTTDWIKDNLGKSLLIAGAVAGGTYLLIKAVKKKPQQPEGLSGTPPVSSNNTKPNRKRRRSKGRPRIQRKNLL